MGQGSTREAELAGDTLRDLLQGTRSHDCGGLVGKFKPHSAGQETERAAPSHLEVAGTSVAGSCGSCRPQSRKPQLCPEGLSANEIRLTDLIQDNLP